MFSTDVLGFQPRFNQPPAVQGGRPIPGALWPGGRRVRLLKGESVTVREQPGDNPLVDRPWCGTTLRALRVWSASRRESERRGGQGHPPARVLGMAGALLTSSPFFFRSFFRSPDLCLPPSWTSFLDICPAGTAPRFDSHRPADRVASNQGWPAGRTAKRPTDRVASSEDGRPAGG